MRRKFAVLCVFYLFVSGAAATGQEAPPTDCDTQAAVSVPFEKINPTLAIPACEEVVRRYPDSNRLIFELGRSFSKSGNFSIALTHFRKAAAQGYAPAQNAIGVCYDKGEGVTKDESEAVNWYRKAAIQGDIPGQLNLGLMYERGTGVPQNYSLAFDWFRKAAIQGSAQAQDSVGYFYSKGMGVERDDLQAVTWFRKAAQQGMAGAQYNLGTMYEHGQGVPENRSQALAWYRKAAKQGFEEAKKKLIALKAEPEDKPRSPTAGLQRKKQAETHARNKEQREAEGSSSPSSSDDVATKNLIYCLMPKAQYGQFSSYDGGKSAQALLEKECKSEYLSFIRACVAAGKNQDSCLMSALVTAQVAIKTFNK